MKGKLLVTVDGGKYKVKDIVIFDHPEGLKTALSKTGWNILKLLAEREMYPIEIAKALKIHEQSLLPHQKAIQGRNNRGGQRRGEKRSHCQILQSFFPSLRS